MSVKDLVERPGSWLATGQDSGAVVSSRIRLARNIHGEIFPGWADEAASVRLWESVAPAVAGLAAMADDAVYDMSALGSVDRQVLQERHIISQELYDKGKGSGVVTRADEAVSVMINEEDHLRLQALRPGLGLAACWAELNDLDSELETKVEYAFDAEFGYLTACPSNVGTGLRASVMMHLPGLTLLEEIEPIIKGLNKIGLAVRGWWGEGTEAIGNMYQISNQITLGESEDMIITQLVRIVDEISEHETNARARLMEQKATHVYDYVGRAVGVLTHARILNSRELLDLLSGLRVGLEFSLVEGVDYTAINKLMLLTQPGHLQIIAGKELDHIERDITRATIAREKLDGMRCR